MLLLAAGGSRRFGRANKLLARWRRRSLLDWSIAAALASPAGRIVVVTGADRARVGRLLGHVRDRRVRVVHNPGWADGLASSLAAGARALRPVDRQVAILLGDMPAIAPAMLARLARRLGTADAVRPMVRGLPGHPVLLRGRLLRERPGAGGDAGLWAGLARDPAVRTRVVSGAPGSATDVDTQSALRRLRYGGTPTRLPRMGRT